MAAAAIAQKTGPGRGSANSLPLHQADSVSSGVSDEAQEQERAWQQLEKERVVHGQVVAEAHRCVCSRHSHQVQATVPARLIVVSLAGGSSLRGRRWKGIRPRRCAAAPGWAACSGPGVYTVPSENAVQSIRALNAHFVVTTGREWQ